eukprot:7268609-Pyramimonas_sp.AAC.2
MDGKGFAHLASRDPVGRARRLPFPGRPREHPRGLAPLPPRRADLASSWRCAGAERRARGGLAARDGGTNAVPGGGTNSPEELTGTTDGVTPARLLANVTFPDMGGGPPCDSQDIPELPEIIKWLSGIEEDGANPNMVRGW